MRIKTSFNFYSDPGHGWLKVPMSVLGVLGIIDKISPYSYQRGENAYLEEDCDASVFMETYRKTYGHEPKIKFHLADKCSKVRSFDHFCQTK